jgi:hypothetical protein
MTDRILASLTFRIRQGHKWASTSLVMPAESASRVVTTLLHEFAGKNFTPADVAVVGEVRRFSYRSDRLIVGLCRIRT